MTRPELPRLVEQTRILLWIQMFLLLVGLLIVTVLIPYWARVLGEAHNAEFFIVYFTLMGTAIVLALSAKMFRHGWALGWVLAVVAELALVSIIVESILFGLFLGLAVILLIAVGAWIATNLFRVEVLQFFFRRRGLMRGSVLPGRAR